MRDRYLEMPAYREEGTSVQAIDIENNDSTSKQDPKYDGGKFGTFMFKNYVIHWLEMVISFVFITYVSLVLLSMMKVWEKGNVFIKIYPKINQWVVLTSIILSIVSMALRWKDMLHSVKNIKTHPVIIFCGLMLIGVLTLSMRFFFSTIKDTSSKSGTDAYSECHPEIIGSVLGHTSGLVFAYIVYVCVKAMFNGNFSYTSNLVRLVSIVVGALIIIGAGILNLASVINHDKVAIAYGVAGIVMAIINMISFDLRTTESPDNKFNWTVAAAAMVLFISSLVMIKKAYCANNVSTKDFFTKPGSEFMCGIYNARIVNSYNAEDDISDQ
ncbi:hypothetical protein CWI40_090500 [Ordospora colligata]|nr:hypothetical protein CWI40_090500 [Ordospora colligata]